MQFAISQHARGLSLALTSSTAFFRSCVDVREGSPKHVSIECGLWVDIQFPSIYRQYVENVAIILHFAIAEDGINPFIISSI